MRRFIRLTTVAALAAAPHLAAQANDETHAYIFKAPVFVLQPGFVTTNLFSKPAGTSTSTDFNARVTTVVPTTVPRLALVALVQWLPFKKVDVSTDAGTASFHPNSPAFVFGPVVNIFNVPWVAFDLDALDSYGPAARASDNSSYTHKLVFEGDLAIKIGSMMMSDTKSHWHSLAIYGLLAYVASGLDSGTKTGQRLVLLTGLSLPIAP